jgi:glycosyltransferase involved in cell wall biosynthesis
MLNCNVNESGATAQRLPSITITTVAKQSYPGLEHIFLDACSTDNTRYPNVRVISEPDDSAHQAMNKGLSLAHGEVIGFLNVDDFYAEGLLIEVGQVFAEKPEIDVVIGHAVRFEESATAGRQIVFERIHDSGDELWLPGVALRSPAFNGSFFRRPVFERIGNFETRVRFFSGYP